MTEKSYSIAHTKNHLPVLVHSLDSDLAKAIPITRRGRVVAYLISSREYDAMKNKTRKFSDEWKSLRNSTDFKKYSFSDNDVSKWRDSSKGRELSF